MKITEKKVQGIRECTRVMRKALREHYDEDQEAVVMKRFSNKKPLREDRYASVEDEINDIENGGYDTFEADDDLIDPYLAAANHKEALTYGRSDLDQANYDGRVANIEDDLAYEVESNGYDDSFIDEVVNKDPEDSYRYYIDSADENGMIHGINITNNDDVMEQVISSYLDYVADSLPIEGSPWSVNPSRVISDTLEILAKYATGEYPSCKKYFECLSAYANKANALLQKLDCSFPEPIVIPAANGVVNESKKAKKAKTSSCFKKNGFYKTPVKESAVNNGEIVCIYMNDYFNNSALKAIADYVESYVGTGRIETEVVEGSNPYILFRAQNEAQTGDIMHLCVFPDEYDIQEMGVDVNRFDKGVFEVIGRKCQKMALL